MVPVTQADSLGSSLPSEVDFGFDALHRPASGDRVGGAWHDTFAITNQRFAVSIGNVAGPESDAAELKRVVRETFAAGAASGAGAAAIGPLLMRATDAIFHRQAASDIGRATWIVGVVDCSDRTFSYMSAGHPPPLIRYHDGFVAALPADGLPIASGELEHPPAHVVVELHDAAVLMLFSAVTVQTAQNRADGLHRLREALAEERVMHCNSPASWLARSILEDCRHDDLALLALTFPARRRSPAARSEIPAGERPRWSVSWSFDATGPASIGARRAFLAFLASKETVGGNAIDLGTAELVFGELLGNVVRHAPGQVEITLDWTAEFPVLHVLDSGPGFRSRRVRERLPADDLSEGGRGLFIINAFARDFHIRNRNGRGTHASVTLPPT